MDRKTINCLCFGLIGSLVLLLPTFEYFYDIDLPFTGFPLDILANGAGYLATFFHEIGHTVFYWFYGYIAVPRFDFQYGGGYSNALTGQLYFVLAGVYAFLGWLIYLNRETMLYVGILLAVMAFHVLTAFTGFHHAIISYMGHGSELAVGGYMLWRALLDRAPRGVGERWLNALFGFFFIFTNIRDAVGLMTSDLERMVYAQQKGGVHLGDFSQIAVEYFNISLQAVAVFHLFCGTLTLLIPFLLWRRAALTAP